jgi:DNA-binding response OmpR family regulator
MLPSQNQTSISLSRRASSEPVPRVAHVNPINGTTRVAIFEEDPAHAAIVTQTLTAAGYVCHNFQTCAALTHMLRRETFDLLVLDGTMQNTLCEEILLWVREYLSARLLVMFLSPRKRECDETSILYAGADDYIIKPVAPNVLLARVTSALRRTHRTESDTKESFGVYEFDMQKRHIQLRGKPVSLSQREFALAHLLFHNLGCQLSRAHILDLVWKQMTTTSSRTVDTHICWLRSKLQLRPENGYRVMPVYGYGYCLERTSQGADLPAEI